MGAYRFGEFVLDSDTHELLRGGQPLHLSPKAFRLLNALVSSRPRAWSKSELQDLLWPDTTVVEANLPNLVAEVRGVLNDDAERPRYLRTIHRFGYAFLDGEGPRTLPGLLQSAIDGAGNFVGRGAELAFMGEAWQRAVRGRRQLILVAGEAGIGKTRLLGEFCRTCHDSGAVTLVGRCDEEALVPYQPYVESLSQFVDSCTELELSRQVANSLITPELARVVPALARRCAGMRCEPLADPESDRFRLFNAVDAMLTSLSRDRPLVVVLEDLHWADKSSLLMLRHLARAQGASAVCLVGTYRDSELSDAHQLSDLLADLRRDQTVARLILGGLLLDDIEQLIVMSTCRQPTRGFARALADRTSGNPFFIREILQHLAETDALGLVQSRRPIPESADGHVPEGVKEVIDKRLSRLTELCKRTLALASVVGCEFPLDVLEQVGDFGDDELLDALDAARAAGVLLEVSGAPGRFSFSHALIRETLYDRLSNARRVRLHRRVADALERLSRSRPVPLADLAYHFTQAAASGNVDRAIEYATGAAREAAAALAHEEAARFFGMALRVLEFRAPGPETTRLRTELHVRRGRAFANVGSWPAARAAFACALETDDSESLDARADILLMLAMASFWVLDIAGLRPLATEALGLANQLGRRDLAGQALGWLGRAEQADGNLDAAIEIDRRALTLTDGVTLGGLVHAPLTLYLAGKLPDAVDLAQNALVQARRAGESSAMMYALSHYGLSLAAAGMYEEAAATFEEARELGRRSGAYPLLARATAMSSGWRVDVFDFKTAEMLQREACEIAREAAFVPTLASAGIDLLFTWARQHDPGRAEKILPEVEDAVSTARGWHGWLFRMRLEQARAEIALARADWSAAAAFATTALEKSRAVARGKYEAAALATRAQALWRQERRRDAKRDARTACTIARRFGDPSLRVRTYAVLLPIIGGDDLVQEARTAANQVRAALPPGARDAFDRSDLVRMLSG
jgi:tetratricopeptide (TPR) repeat protein